MNNKLRGEFTKLKNAIEQIAELEGADQRLDGLIENIAHVENPVSVFVTDGITYTKRFGPRIEHKLTSS